MYFLTLAKCVYYNLIFTFGTHVNKIYTLADVGEKSSINTLQEIVIC